MDQQGSSTPVCVACRETIKPGARVCPHCGTAQQPTRWHDFGAVLKWIGGIVTVISLVLGVKTLLDYYQQWQQRQDAVSELVSAAEWLVKTENFSQAWDMYREANTLSPGSPESRQGQYTMAIAWIRDFTIDKGSADQVLNDLTAVLYRNLRYASDDQAATILAYVARIQILRWHYDLPVLVDDEQLLGQALELSPANVYANTFLAHRLLLKRPVSEADIEKAQHHFGIALADGRDRQWVRDMQVSRLGMTATDNSAVGNAAMRAFLRTAHDMMVNGEMPPAPDLRVRILDSYGHMGSGKRIEALIDAVSPEQHLAVNAWLRKGLAYYTERRSYYPAQQDYLVARLLEEKGETATALERYRALEMSDQTYSRLDTLVDNAIERLTGEKTARAQQRSYSDDPVDTGNPWAFHLDTLQHFNPKWLSRNFDQAVEYFETAIDSADERVTELLDKMPVMLSRVQALVSEGEERARMKAFTSGYNISSYDFVRQRWTDLMLLQAAALRKTGDVDSAIAIASDALTFVEPLGEEFDQWIALSAYELALGYAQRANTGGGADDRNMAIEALLLAEEHGAVRDNLVSWEDIKGSEFASLKTEAGYQELIRGR